jgi:hypothetical protein
MAIIYRCDRCLTDFTNSNELRPIDIPHMNQHGSFTDDSDDTYRKGLCSQCWDEIIKLVTGYKKVVNK